MRDDEIYDWAYRIGYREQGSMPEPEPVTAGIQGKGPGWRWQLRDSAGRWINMGLEVEFSLNGQWRHGRVIGSPKEGVVTVRPRFGGADVDVPSGSVSARYGAAKPGDIIGEDSAGSRIKIGSKISHEGEEVEVVGGNWSKYEVDVVTKDNEVLTLDMRSSTVVPETGPRKQAGIGLDGPLYVGDIVAPVLSEWDKYEVLGPVIRIGGKEDPEWIRAYSLRTGVTSQMRSGDLEVVKKKREPVSKAVMAALPPVQEPVTAGGKGLSGPRWMSQLRDVAGRWIEMGSEVEWSDKGNIVSGKVVGSPEPGMVLVQRKWRPNPDKVRSNVLTAKNARGRDIPEGTEVEWDEDGRTVTGRVSGTEEWFDPKLGRDRSGKAYVIVDGQPVEKKIDINRLKERKSVRASAGKSDKYDFGSRLKMGKHGTAMKDGSYPIADAEDLHNAIQAYGRAKDPEAVKRHIIKRARALKMISALPEKWGVKK